MGQRFQSIFILPKVFMNEDNPNNRDKKVLVFHNQWLYGYMAVEINLKIMQRLQKAIKHNKKGKYFRTTEDIINHRLENSLNNAIKYCGLEPIENERKFDLSTDFIFENYIKFARELINQDNNNGFFICEIDNKLNFTYSFISGFEDENNIKIKTPYEYVNLFYSDEDIKKFSEYDKKRFDKLLNDWVKFKTIDSDKINQVVKILNENKPSWLIAE